MRITAAVLLVLMACGTASAQQGHAILPPLLEGDVVLVDSYPWADSLKPDRGLWTMRLCRLGYPSVRAFKVSKGLPANKEVDAETDTAILQAYRKVFGYPEGDTPVWPELSVGVEATKGFTSFATRITIRNAAGRPARILGHIRYQSNGDFTFAEPFVRATVTVVGTPRGGYRNRQENLVCRDSFRVDLRAGQTIGPNADVTFRSDQQLLNEGETGRLAVHLMFLDSSFRIMEIHGESELLQR